MRGPSPSSQGGSGTFHRSQDRSQEAAASDVRLTEELVRQVLGWKVAPDRFIKSGRSWLPKWRFAPLSRLDDAFQLLDRSASTYKLERTRDNAFSVEVQFDGRIGKASGEPKARTITIALAHALGLELPDEVGATVSVPVRRRPRSRSKLDGI